MARGRDNPGQMAAPEKLTATQVSDIDGLDDWRVLLRSLHSSFRSGSMAKGLELAGRIAAAADAANHHPDLTITYPRVYVSLTTHETRSLTARDVDLARTISAIAAELEVPAEPVVATQLAIASDALPIAAVRPFWAAVHGYRSDADDEVVDPFGPGPAFCFPQMQIGRASLMERAWKSG